MTRGLLPQFPASSKEKAASFDVWWDPLARAYRSAILDKPRETICEHRHNAVFTAAVCAARRDRNEGQNG